MAKSCPNCTAAERAAPTTERIDLASNNHYLTNNNHYKHSIARHINCIIIVLVLAWNPTNIKHVERHMPVKVWEDVFYALHADTFPHPEKTGRYIREAKIYGAYYRLVFAVVGPDRYLPITGHRIDASRRTKP